MKYNKSEIMTRAWFLSKTYKRPFGHALKVAWMEAKERVQFAARIEAAELPELTGSDKQIAWANDIRKTALDTCINTTQMRTAVFRINNVNDKEAGSSLNLDADAAAFAGEQTFEALLASFATVTDAKVMIDRRARVSASAVCKAIEGLHRQKYNALIAA